MPKIDVSTYSSKTRTAISGFLVVFFLWCIGQNVYAQIKSASPSSRVISLRSFGRVLTVPPTGHVTEPVVSTVSTRLSEHHFHSPRRASLRESEIAAIFRGVAYRTSTFYSDTTTSSSAAPSTETSPTLRTTVTIRDIFDSHHVSFNSDKIIHQRQKKVKIYVTPTTDSDIHKIAADFISDVLHDDKGITHTSYRHHTLNVSKVNKDDPKQTTIPMAQDNSVILEDNKKHEYKGRLHISKENGIKWALGAAWWIHVYVSAVLFALVAAVSLCCLGRLSPSTHMLSHFQYISILILVFIAAIFQCLHLFHDPYGTENRFPDFVMVVVKEISWPCLTGALTIIGFSLNQFRGCYHVSLKSSLPKSLLFLPYAHLLFALVADVLACLMEKYSFPIRITVQSVAVIWGSTVGLGSLWVAWKLERSVGQSLCHFLRWFNHSAIDDLATSQCSQLCVNDGSFFILVSGVSQVMLAALHFYTILASVTPVKYIWAWWIQVSMARGLEMIISIALLTGIYIFTAGRRSQNKLGNTIFTVMKASKGGRCANVFPMTNEKRQTSGTFNFHMTKPSKEKTNIEKFPFSWSYTTPRTNKVSTLDSDLSDFQLHCFRDRAQSAAVHRTSSMLVNDNGFIRFRTHIDPEQPMDKVFEKSSFNAENVSALLTNTTAQNYNTQTLPHYRSYCKSNAISLSSLGKTPLRNPIRAQTISAQRSKPEYLGHSKRSKTATLIKDQQTWLPDTSKNKYDKYDITSYEDSSASSANHMCSTLNVVSPSQIFLQKLRSNCFLPEVNILGHPYKDTRQLKPEAVGVCKVTNVCSYLSEIHSENRADCMKQNSLCNKYYSKRDQRMNTFPLHSLQPNCGPSAPKCSISLGRTPSAQLSDTTIDSAVIIDHSTSTETEKENTKSLDFLKSNSYSVNDIKCQASDPIIVGSNMVESHRYFFQEVEDISQEDSSLANIQRVCSSTELSNKKTSNILITPPHFQTKSFNSFTAL